MVNHFTVLSKIMNYFQEWKIAREAIFELECRNYPIKFV